MFGWVQQLDICIWAGEECFCVLISVGLLSSDGLVCKESYINCFLLISLVKTGSGKTYTMWGPPSVMSEGTSSIDRGLSPRVFERLFCRIDEVKNFRTSALYEILPALCLKM